MFKFSTNTILNSIAAGAYHELYQDTDHKLIHIHHLGKFKNGCVTKIFKRASNAGTAGKVEITIAPDETINSYKVGGAGEAKGIYRLNLYVRLGQGSQNSEFAHYNLLKGKPLAYEFEAKTAAKATAAEIAKGLEAAIKYETTRFGSKWVDVKADGAKLTLTAVGPDACYQWFDTVELQKFDASVDSALVGGEYVTISDESSVVNTMCEYPFGTYGQLIKDLRLPTQENTSWTAINADDKPSLGVTYTQYMIYMSVDRGVMGGDAVGEVVTSVTAHSIWVNDNLVSDFEAALAAVELPTPVAFNADNLSNEKDTAHAFAPADGVISEADITVIPD